MEFLEDEEFEKWFKGVSTREVLSAIDGDGLPYGTFIKRIAQFAWQSSLELFRTDYCDDCGLNRKLLPCRPAVNCRKNEGRGSGLRTTSARAVSR